MKKILYLLLVVPFLFLMISCVEKKSAEQIKFENALNGNALSAEEMFEKGYTMNCVQTMNGEDYMTIHGEAYKNCVRITIIYGNESKDSYYYCEFKDDDVILTPLTEDYEDAINGTKTYLYDTIMLYEEVDEDGKISQQSLKEALSSVDTSFIKYSDFKKVENGYVNKKDISTSYLGVNIKYTTIDVVLTEDGLPSRIYFEGSSSYGSYTSTFTYLYTYNYDVELEYYLIDYNMQEK